MRSHAQHCLGSQMANCSCNQIKPLEDAEALNRGAEIIGETTIFTVAVLVMGLEYSRQKSSEARREALAQEIHDREQQVMVMRIVSRPNLCFEPFTIVTGLSCACHVRNNRKYKTRSIC